MSETGTPLAGSTDPKEERALNQLEKIVFGTKIAAGLLALTYVSGYLISTTYLSTYGIVADTSNLLRAKYIYIGFLYWMPVIAIGLVARAIALFIDSPKLLPSHGSEDEEWLVRKKRERVEDAERYQAREALEMRSIPGNDRNRQGHVRHVWLAALVLLLFVTEIMLVKPGGFVAYLPLQAIFLLTISLYQTTFYREYSSKSYGWGTVYGEETVDQMRWWYGIVIALIIELFMGMTWVSYWVNFSFVPSRAHVAVYWIAKSLLVLFAIVVFSYILGGSIFVTVSSETLQSLESSKSLRGRSSRLMRVLDLHVALVAVLWISLKHLFPLKAFRWNEATIPVLSSVFCFLALVVLLGEHVLPLVAFVDYGALVLALIILSNLLVLSYMHFKKYRDLNVKYSIDWRSWLLIGVEGSILYLVSVLGFSYVVYPALPLEKAGGKYAKAYAVTVSLNHGEAGCISTALNTTFEAQPLHNMSKGKTDVTGKEQVMRLQQRFIVLDEDSNWSYLAPLDGPDAGGGPAAWRWWALCDEYDEYYGIPKAGGVCRPRVYAVNRRCIADTKSIEPQ